CITFSGQMMGCVPLDEKGLPLRKAIIWADTRAVAQVNRLAEKISLADVYAITGHRLSSSYSLAKILWLKDNQPDIYNATHKFVHAKDAVIARLTGKFATEPSDASGMNLYNLEKWDWSERIMAAAGLAREQLPEIVASTAVIGTVLPEIADEVGLVAGTSVVMGGGDGACAAVGAGVVGAGSAYNYVGSSSWIAIASEKPIYDPAQRTFTFAHVVPQMYMPTGTMQAAGASYQWTRDHLGTPEVAEAAAQNESPYELMNKLASQSPAGANGLIYLPYLMGERSPHWNPNARGGYVGLTIRHSRADMIRATLEGITFNLRIILDAFQKQGAGIEAMRVIGGGARGLFWNQVMADIYEMPVQRLAILEEATSMGAALTGGIGVGLYPDFSMAEQMNGIVSEVMPETAVLPTYRQLYPLFEATYIALEPIFEELAAIE
ncbi:MAG: FGGY-family carbohydrate kinase, partial [Chloroflexota bacterium]